MESTNLEESDVPVGVLHQGSADEDFAGDGVDGEVKFVLCVSHQTVSNQVVGALWTYTSLNASLPLYFFFPFCQGVGWSLYLACRLLSTYPLPTSAANDNNKSDSNNNNDGDFYTVVSLLNSLTAAYNNRARGRR